LIVLLWRAGLRISEALGLAESDLDPSRGSVPVRCGRGGKRREAGMDHWAWQQLNAWLELRVVICVGALLCILDGPTQGRLWSPTAAHATLRQLAADASSANSSRRINSGTLTPSRWHTRAFRWS
jgi:site-specific recombinase XerC